MFFFFKQKTAYEMRISDWSSDVCSSDLVQVCDYLSREQSREHYEAGTEFHIASIEMVANTGTYIDCPFHRYADGADLSQVEAAAFADLDGIVVRAGRGNAGAIAATLARTSVV